MSSDFYLFCFFSLIHNYIHIFRLIHNQYHIDVLNHNYADLLCTWYRRNLTSIFYYYFLLYIYRGNDPKKHILFHKIHIKMGTYYFNIDVYDFFLGFNYIIPYTLLNYIVICIHDFIDNYD